MVDFDRWKCPNCKRINIKTYPCKYCGFKYTLHYPHLWRCPECNNLVKDSNYCKKCNYPKDLHYPELWHCPRCNTLVKSSTTCPKCKSRKKKRNKILRKEVISFIVALITIIVILFFVNNTSVHKESNTFNYTLASASLTLPLWEETSSSESSISFYDTETMQSLNYFINEPYFSTIEYELQSIYSNLNDVYELTTTLEYTRNEWSVLCFTSDVFDACVSAVNCESNIVFLQLTSYHSNFDYEMYNTILDSFCCNC